MDKKKRIVFLSRYVGVSDRGVESYVLELSKRLKKDFDIEIYNKGDADNIGKVISGKFDVVIPTNGRSQSLKVFFGKFFSGYKVIIPGQAGVGRDDIWNLLIAQPDVYAALTDYELNWAKKFAWRTKLVKIPNGVDLDKFNPHGEKYNTLGFERPIILSVGALEWYKHHELSIKAVSKMEKGSLLIVGKGELEDKLSKMGKDLLGEKRFKIINVPFEEIPKIYRAAQVFTLPSWIRESFGIVYVEAMATGIGVVAPNDPPRREIIGNGGILVDVEDDMKFSRALEEAVNRNWGNLPRMQAEKFNWNLVAQKYKDLINSLV